MEPQVTELPSSFLPSAKDVDWTQAFSGSVKNAIQTLASGRVQLPAGGAILRSHSRRHFYRITTATLPASQPSCATLPASAMSHAEPQAVGFSPPSQDLDWTEKCHGSVRKMQAAISAGQVLLPQHGVYVRSASRGIYFHIMLKAVEMGQSPSVDGRGTRDSTTAPSHHADPADDDSDLPHCSAAAPEPSAPRPSTAPALTAEAQSPNSTATLGAAQNPDTVSVPAAPRRKHTRWVSTEPKRDEAAPPLHNFLLQLLEGADNTYVNVKRELTKMYSQATFASVKQQVQMVLGAKASLRDGKIGQDEYTHLVGMALRQIVQNKCTTAERVKQDGLEQLWVVNCLDGRKTELRRTPSKSTDSQTFFNPRIFLQNGTVVRLLSDPSLQHTQSDGSHEGLLGTILRKTRVHRAPRLTDAADDAWLASDESVQVIGRVCVKDQPDCFLLEVRPMQSSSWSHGFIDSTHVQYSQTSVGAGSEDDTFARVEPLSQSVAMQEPPSPYSVVGFLRRKFLFKHRRVSMDNLPTACKGLLETKNGSFIFSSWVSTLYRLQNGMLDAYPAADSNFSAKKSGTGLSDSLSVEMSRIRSSVDLSLSVVTRKGRLLIVTVRGKRQLTLRASSEAVAAEWLDSILYHMVWMRRGEQRTVGYPPTIAPPPGHATGPRSDKQPRTLATSLFKQVYHQVLSAPPDAFKLLKAVQKIVHVYCLVHNLPATVAHDFYQDLSKEICAVPIDPKVGVDVSLCCQVLWTSAKLLKHKGQPLLEFSSLLNRVLQTDGFFGKEKCDAMLREKLMHCTALVCRGINMLCVHTTPKVTGDDLRMVEMLRERADAAPFPPGGVTYRGGGFPAEHKQFFRLGRKFRAPCFLATSFSCDRAEQFRSQAREQGFDTILWRVEVDPSGEHDATRRCQHVNYVTKRAVGVPDEQEYLFTQYAPFQVKYAHWSDEPKRSPHRVTLTALLDSKKESETLPLSPWN